MKGKKWWHNKVAYQIYIKSFKDTNGDGIGDLRGIIEKLDYLKGLGIDILWISPCYCSPLADQGYDISDYYNIDPKFGNMDDMEELISEAKKRNMYILMDLVINHCSDEHEWFQKAIKDPKGKYGKYFYIEKGRWNEDTKQFDSPCNWRSYFGGSVWDKLPGFEDMYYLHMFHKKQPDLNWENEELREDIYKMMNWWLDKGLGGFRIDAIINIKKALPFRNYTADREDNLVSCSRMIRDAKGIGVFLQEMRDRTFARYESFTVGEVFNANEDEIPDYIGEDGYFSSMFDFRSNIFGESKNGWFDRKEILPDDYKRCIFESQTKINRIGFLSNIIENHDEPRGVNHYILKNDRNDYSKKLLATVYVMLRGIPFIYQGQELGMENTVFNSIDEINDVSTIDQYHVALANGLSEMEALQAVGKYSRDNARTPFQWNSSENAGFTTGNPWLKLNPNYSYINAYNEEHDKNSVLWYYKKLISLRKSTEYEDAFIYGEFIPAFENVPNLIGYYRVGIKHKILVLANFQKEKRLIKLQESYQKELLNNYCSLDIIGMQIELKAYQSVVLQI